MHPKGRDNEQCAQHDSTPYATTGLETKFSLLLAWLLVQSLLILLHLQRQSNMSLLSQRGQGLGGENNKTIHKANIIWRQHHVAELNQSLYVCCSEVVGIQSEGLWYFELTVTLILGSFCSLLSDSASQRSRRCDPKIIGSWTVAVWSVWEIEMVFFFFFFYETAEWDFDNPPPPKKKVSLAAKPVDYLARVA